jgi:hypothetical protein
MDALHTAIKTAIDTGELDNVVDALLNECPNMECGVCAEIVCPGHEPLHFHHDGCPHCATNSKKESDHA